MQPIYKHKKSGRICYAFPWASHKIPCPWNAGTYERVLLPLTESEKRNSQKKVHVQIFKRTNLEAVKPTVLAIR